MLHTSPNHHIQQLYPDDSSHFAPQYEVTVWFQWDCISGLKFGHMDVLGKLLGPLLGSSVDIFHSSSNSHRNGDCPCKLQISTVSIWTAAETNDFETVRRRIDMNSTLSSKFDPYGYTALHYAAQQNHVKIVEFLISRGCPPDANSCGATPLHRAAYSGSLHSCELLLEAGADPNAADSSYRDLGSPLHKAYSIASLPIVTLLLAHGADPTRQDASGKTPQELLKKRHYSLFKDIMIANNENSLIAEEKKISTFREIDVVSKSDPNGEIVDLPNDKSVSLNDASGELYMSSNDAVVLTNIVEVAKSVGLPCNMCLKYCLSFSRLTDGSLVCTDCKYNI